MPEERREEAEGLGRYWDALVEGRPEAPHATDRTLADAVRWAHALDDAPGPAPSFVDRLHEDLMNAASHPGASTAAANGRAPSRPLRWRALRLGPSRGRQAPAHLATAVLVLLTLAAGFLALVLQRRFALLVPKPGHNEV